jgi:hypothetical protein
MDGDVDDRIAAHTRLKEQQRLRLVCQYMHIECLSDVAPMTKRASSCTRPTPSANINGTRSLQRTYAAHRSPQSTLLHVLSTATATCTRGNREDVDTTHVFNVRCVKYMFIVINCKSITGWML